MHLFDSSVTRLFFINILGSTRFSKADCLPLMANQLMPSRYKGTELFPKAQTGYKTPSPVLKGQLHILAHLFRSPPTYHKPTLKG